MLNMGFVHEILFGRDSSSPVAIIAKNWQVSVESSRCCPKRLSRSVATTVCCGSGRQQSIDVIGDAKPGFEDAGQTVGMIRLFSRKPGNKWGNSGRNAFRAPTNYNLDASLFRVIPIERAGSNCESNRRTC